MTDQPGTVDEFDEYLAEQMRDPSFRAAYVAAELRAARSEPFAVMGEAMTHLGMCLIQATVSLRDWCRRRKS